MALLKRGSDDERAAKEEQKNAERARKDAEQHAKEVERRKNLFFESPAGQARQAKEAGQRWFQIELTLAETSRSLAAMLYGEAQPGIATTTRRADGQGVVLTEIEDEGWELFQAGFVFKETGAVSRDKLLSSGQNVSVTGSTLGVYLFRATEAPLRTDEPWRS